MSLLAWISPNFWYQLRFLRPHRVNGKWHMLKRDICLPYNHIPVIECRMTHMKYEPPLMGRWVSWIMSTSIFRRSAQTFWDHVVYRLKPRGNCLSDYVGDQRRQIRYAVIVKNRDPYVWMLLGARNLRMRHWRTFGWQVPEKHGPGPGMGMVPHHLDYMNKITRMTEDDYTDTGVSTYAMKMWPVISMRKYFNELPRITAYSYGKDHTKEEMFNHIAWGIDQGNFTIDELMQPSDPERLARRLEEKDVSRYLWPDLAPAFEPGYKLKWPFPDDNIYRPTYNRGSNRRYWARSYG